MLAKSLIEEIDRLLREGKLSQRKIAAQLGVSRGIVSSIASGRRGLHGREADEDERYPYSPRSRAQRCPVCGYRVYMPCVICSSRDFQQRRRELQRATEDLQTTTVVRVEPRKQRTAETRRPDFSTDSLARDLNSPSFYILADSAIPRGHFPVLLFIPSASYVLA